MDYYNLHILGPHSAACSTTSDKKFAWKAPHTFVATSRTCQVTQRNCQSRRKMYFMLMMR